MTTPTSRLSRISVLREYLTLARIQGAAVTALTPILGALAVHPRVDWGWLGVLWLIGLSFHLFGFILNEVVDVGIDAIVPAKQGKPLVKGSVARWKALTLALFQIPLIVFLGVFFFGADSLSLAVLFSSILLATAYDLWGKRFPLSPVLADGALAFSLGLLCLYGALVVQLKAERVTDLPALKLPLLVASLTSLQVMFNNGVEGGLKDLEYDLLCGARTTAGWFGAILREGNELSIPPALKAYSLALKGLAAFLLTLPLFLHWLPYRGRELILTSIALTGLLIMIFASMAAFLWGQSSFHFDRLKRLFLKHEVLTYSAVPVLFWFHTGAARGVLMLVFPIAWYITCNLILYGRPLELHWSN